MRISKEWIITEKKQKNRIEGPGEILIAAFVFDGVAGNPPPPISDNIKSAQIMTIFKEDFVSNNNHVYGSLFLFNVRGLIMFSFL